MFLFMLFVTVTHKVVDCNMEERQENTTTAWGAAVVYANLWYSESSAVRSVTRGSSVTHPEAEQRVHEGGNGIPPFSKLVYGKEHSIKSVDFPCLGLFYLQSYCRGLAEIEVFEGEFTRIWMP